MILDNTRNAPAKPDAEILAAWGRIGANNRNIDALNGSDQANDDALWDEISKDERVIHAATAATPAGVEVQLWCYLMHSVPSSDDEKAVLRRDIAYFTDLETEYDWTERLVFSAIRSLQAMAAPREQDDAPSPFAMAMQAYRDANNMAICFHLLNNPGEGVGTDEQWNAFEAAFDGYVDKAGTAARAALMTPATSAADMIGKQTILDEQEAHLWNDGQVEAYTRQLIADALHLAGEGA